MGMFIDVYMIRCGCRALRATRCKKKNRVLSSVRKKVSQYNPDFGIAVTCIVMACVFMAYIVMACAVMACMFMACIVVAHIAMVYIVAMARMIMACIVMAMAHIVTPFIVVAVRHTGIFHLLVSK